MSKPSLDALLDKLCQGDLEAAEQVFVAYEPYLRQVVRRQFSSRLRTRFDSLDIVQSAWKDLVHGFREAGWRFTSTAQLQAFLVKVTRNRFIDPGWISCTSAVSRHSFEVYLPRSREENRP